MKPSLRITLLAAAFACGHAHSADTRALAPYLQHEAALLALTHARLIDGNGGPPQEDRTVIVQGDRIAAVGDAATPIPAGAAVIDLSGRTVLPGLVGMHNHLMYVATSFTDAQGKLPAPGFMLAELPYSAPRLYLAGGVTTMRTTGSIEPLTDLHVRDAIDAGQLPGPHIDVSGPYLEGAHGWFPQMQWTRSPADARRAVAYWASQGVSSIKAYENLGEAALAAAIDEAHRHGLKITAHLCAVGFSRAAELGIDNIEHGPVFTDSEFVAGRQPDVCPDNDKMDASWEQLAIDSAPVQQLIATLVRHKVALTSTLPVREASIPTRPLLPRRQRELLWSESLSNYLRARSTVALKPALARQMEAILQKEMAFERAFVAAGGLLMAGPDPTGNGGVLPGFGDQRGIELLVEAGFSASQAIQIASANGARYLGKFDQFGSVEAGKRADLVVVRGDPSQDIRAIENVETVFKDGQAFDPARLIDSVRGMVGLR